MSARYCLFVACILFLSAVQASINTADDSERLKSSGNTIFHTNSHRRSLTSKNNKSSSKNKSPKPTKPKPKPKPSSPKAKRSPSPSILISPIIKPFPSPSPSPSPVPQFIPSPPTPNSPPPPVIIVPPPPAAPDPPKLSTYRVVAAFPHDPKAFTEGLQYENRCTADAACKPILWESTGMYNQSSMREVELATGNVLRSKSLPPNEFGEGVTRFGNQVYQLVWMTSKIYSYAVDDFNMVNAIQSPLKDGWGMTNDGTSLIISDGTDKISFVDPSTFQLKSEISVRDEGRVIRNINELEWVNGLIYANIWQTECIAQIDPSSGKVVGWLLMQGLRAKAMQMKPNSTTIDVLNGIAYDAVAKRLFVTGKYWPALYQVDTVPLSSFNTVIDIPPGIPTNILDARNLCIVSTV